MFSQRQCSESSSLQADRGVATGAQRPPLPLPLPPHQYPSLKPLLSPQSPVGGGIAPAAATLTPGSRRSRNSMQRQTFSLPSSSSDSSPQEREGEQERGGGAFYDSAAPPPAPLFPHASSPPLSPFVRRRRQPPVDRRQLENTPSPLEAPPSYAAYSGNAAAAVAATCSPAVGTTAERGGPPPKSPPSIHRYGYRSPRFGVGEDGDSSSGEGWGGGRGGCSPERSPSGAVTGAATVAREVVGWTRPVLEGGSVRLAAGEA